MSILIEMYNEIIQEAEGINLEIEEIKERISEINEDYASGVPERIKNLESQLEKIDDYILKIEAFRKLAEKNIESKNVLTIEAPEGYRVNLNRLRQWAMLIDPMSSDDPYAQRVYLVAMCDVSFLNKKKSEFVKRIEELKNDRNTGLGKALKRMESEIEKKSAEYKAFLFGEKMERLSEAIKSSNSQYWYEFSPTVFSKVEKQADSFAVGAYTLPITVPSEWRQDFKKMFGKFYDEINSRVLIPLEWTTDKEYAISISCSPGRGKLIDKALQNIILSTVEKYPAGQNKIYILDGVRFNSSVLGSLRPLEDSFAMERIPRNPEQLSSLLEKIVSGFSDIDDMIELSDSVSDYNKDKELRQRIPKTSLIIFGWPNAFEGKDREYMYRIMSNYERYGISFINVSFSNKPKENDDKIMLPEYAAINAIRIVMTQKETTIKVGEQPLQNFTWYTMSESLSNSYLESIKEIKLADKSVTTVYPELYDCTSFPRYVRSYKRIDLPFGIDGKGKAHNVSFENENFASYLVGASRSGKSTLLHVLIAGLIRNYHPDNVELWLADFKQLEFKKYIEHCPPHIKYVLLDESTELVFDLIDKLTDEMLHRQKLFARLGKERIDQIDTSILDAPLPVIFVILDEFSIMSQAIADTETYRLKLQNVLAKGAALGIRFLFSSQTFTTGVAGLTPTARAQIQQRIAMKGSKEEISDTLELSANLKTEKVQNWMDALPPHYALLKYRISADALPQVIRVLVMYFPDYGVRDNLIDIINQSMTATEIYQPGLNNTYVSKHPVLVDGNSYEGYSQDLIDRFLVEELNKEDSYKDEVAISLGTPRLMSKIKPVILSKETRENILLIGRGTEQMCMASILTSMALAYLSKNKRVRVWAYGKNRLYRLCHDKIWNTKEFDEVKYFEGIESISEEIKELATKIRNKENGDDLIVLIGIDRIYMDFEFLEKPRNGRNLKHSHEELNFQSFIEEKEVQLAKSGILATDDEEKRRAKKAIEWMVKKKGILNRLKGEGKSEEEIKKELEVARDEFFHEEKSEETKKQEVIKLSDKIGEIVEEQVQEDKMKKKDMDSNVMEDYLFVLKQGSRMGYHFVAAFNNLSDIKSANLRLDLFRHRLAFQLPIDDSIDLFGKRVANSLPSRICQYSNLLESFSFRPYLHKGLSWDGWEMDESGTVISPY